MYHDKCYQTCSIQSSVTKTFHFFFTCTSISLQKASQETLQIVVVKSSNQITLNWQRSRQLALTQFYKKKKNHHHHHPNLLNHKCKKRNKSYPKHSRIKSTRNKQKAFRTVMLVGFSLEDIQQASYHYLLNYLYNLFKYLTCLNQVALDKTKRS